MGKALLEKLAVATSTFVIVAAVWFWVVQVGDVLELLALASGATR